MKRCPPLRFRAAMIAATLLIALFAVSVYGQSQFGNIYGKVQAKDGALLPGVTVTLSGVGAPQTFITDSSGAFRFLNLSPGAYQLKAELAGFGTSVRQGIEVNVGRNAEVSITLNPAVEQSITVTAEAPLIDTRKTGTGAVISRAELEQIPTGRDPWVIMGQAPGVLLDRVNVGGSESGQQDIVVAKGASDTQKTFNLDGVNITDVGAIGSTPTYYDFDSFEEIQVTTGGSDPRIQTPGAQLNMVTKRGTNDIKGAVRYFATRGDWQSSTTPSGEAARYLADGNKINNIANWSFDVGGPIIRDKLWFWGADAKQDIKLFVGQVLNYNSAGVATPGPITRDNTILKDWNAKLNFQPFANNSGTYFYTYGNKLKFGRFADSQHPPEATEDQSGPSHLYKAEDTHVFNQSFYLTALYSHILSPFQFVPEGGANTEPFIDTNGTWHRSYFTYATRRPQTSYRADGSFFKKTGALDNEFKFGFGHRRAPVTSVSGYATDVVADFSQDLAWILRSGRQNYVVKYEDYYVGDTITVGNLTVQGGLRWDRQSGRNGAVDILANQQFPDLLGAVTIPADKQALKWNSVSPRLGFTYTLPGSRRALLRGSYNRYVDQMAGGLVGAGNPYNYANGLYYYWTDANGDKTVQKSELHGVYGPYGNVDPANPTSTNSLVRLDYHMKPPKTDELIGGFETELLTDLSVGVDYTYRKFSDFWWNVHEKHQGQGDFYSPADYDCSTMLTGTLPNGKAFSVPNCKLKAGIAAPQFRVITTRPDYTQKYNGIDLYATKRMSNHWMLRGSFSFNDRKQHVGAAGIEDPTHLLDPPAPAGVVGNYFGCTSCDGSIALDKSYGTHTNTYISAKWQYNLTGLYQFPWQIALGANLTGRQGYPIPYYYRLGARRVLINGLDGSRNPNLRELDMRLAKDFSFGGKVGFTIAAEAFNILNARTVLQRNNRVYRASGTPNCAQVGADGKPLPPEQCAVGPLNATDEVQVPRVFRVSGKITF